MLLLAIPVCRDLSKIRCFTEVLAKFSEQEKKSMITWLATVGKLEMAMRMRGLESGEKELESTLKTSLRSCANLHWRILNTIYHGENLFYLCLGRGHTDMTITTTINYLESLNLQSLDAESKF